MHLHNTNVILLYILQEISEGLNYSIFQLISACLHLQEKGVYCLSISCNRLCYKHKHSEVTAQHSLLARYFIQRVERGHCVFEGDKLHHMCQIDVHTQRLTFRQV